VQKQLIKLKGIYVTSSNHERIKQFEKARINEGSAPTKSNTNHKQVHLSVVGHYVKPRRIGDSTWGAHKFGCLFIPQELL